MCPSFLFRTPAVSSKEIRVYSPYTVHVAMPIVQSCSADAFAVGSTAVDAEGDSPQGGAAVVAFGYHH